MNNIIGKKTPIISDQNILEVLAFSKAKIIKTNTNDEIIIPPLNTKISFKKNLPSFNIENHPELKNLSKLASILTDPSVSSISLPNELYLLKNENSDIIYDKNGNSIIMKTINDVNYLYTSNGIEFQKGIQPIISSNVNTNIKSQIASSVNKNPMYNERSLSNKNYQNPNASHGVPGGVSSIRRGLGGSGGPGSRIHP
jgi:hypothetical protein